MSRNGKCPEVATTFARVIDEIDDENWLMMFVQELEVHVKQIIQMERKIKQLIHQAREGRADGYKDLIKGLTIQLKSKKSTLLDCLNDILRYFQDRLRSKDIRTFKEKNRQYDLLVAFVQTDSNRKFEIIFKQDIFTCKHGTYIR